MTRLADSRLDGPTPPLKFTRPFPRAWWIGCAIIGVMAVAGAIAPLFIRQSKCRDWGPAELTNLRQIGLALFEFENEYGKYPDATTIEAVRKKSGTDLSLGTRNSNDFFRQLLAVNITQSERLFYAKGSGVRKPDDVIAGARALEKGECGFTYFLGATKLGNPSRPLAAAPMIPATERFDPKPFKGKAVILKLDNSVTSLPIDKDGHVILHGRNLMDPHHPIWEGHAPVIAWPE